ncbi:hypothetical protein FSP39_025373 [Pinctada imbricata]|uniref:Uncharacterized protein n=1 Tax=Pinctada imbricata TaxID=66713 RepID=A0AA88XUR3_PINIB|nr:hypothetical protein FSP39_025373 [Pinctada imbricata]
MDNQDNDCSDQTPENWLNSFEEQCLEELETEPNMEENLEAERELAEQKLWLQFQNSATAIAQLYKDRHQGLSLWVPFQNAASCVTSLYKDSVDSLNSCVDLGVQKGRQHRNKDIIAWVKKKRRHIRREDLLAFLCGKSAPTRNRLSAPLRHSQNARLSMERNHSPRLASAESIQPSSEPDLQAFREAIALQGLNGAMSNVSVGFPRSHGASASPSLPSLQRTGTNNMEELNHFILEEFSRNYDASRKRTSSPDHMLIDSPSRKRGRFF